MGADKKLNPSGEVLLKIEKNIKSPERRKLLKAFAALMAASVYYSPFALAGGKKEYTLLIISFDEFLLFSELVTGYHQLDHAMARELYRLFKKEAWGMNHLYRVTQKLSHPDRQQLESLDEGEKWFFGHLLTSWITGIYYHSSGNSMVSYEHALMYDAFEGSFPTPGFSSQEFGFWSSAPLQEIH